MRGELGVLHGRRGALHLGFRRQRDGFAAAGGGEELAFVHRRREGHGERRRGIHRSGRRSDGGDRGIRPCVGEVLQRRDVGARRERRRQEGARPASSSSLVPGGAGALLALRRFVEQASGQRIQLGSQLQHGETGFLRPRTRARPRAPAGARSTAPRLCSRPRAAPVPGAPGRARAASPRAQRPAARNPSSASRTSSAPRRRPARGRVRRDIRRARSRSSSRSPPWARSCGAQWAFRARASRAASSSPEPPATRAAASCVARSPGSAFPETGTARSHSVASKQDKRAPNRVRKWTRRRPFCSRRATRTLPGSSPAAQFRGQPGVPRLRVGVREQDTHSPGASCWICALHSESTSGPDGSGARRDCRQAQRSPHRPS